MLIRVSRNPYVALEVIARLLFKRHAPAHHTVVDRIHSIQPIANPAGADFEQHDFQAWEFVKRAILHKTGQGMPEGIRSGNVKEKGLLTHVFTIVTTGPRPLRFERDVKSER